MPDPRLILFGAVALLLLGKKKASADDYAYDPGDFDDVLDADDGIERDATVRVLQEMLMNFREKLLEAQSRALGGTREPYTTGGGCDYVADEDPNGDGFGVLSDGLMGPCTERAEAFAEALIARTGTPASRNRAGTSISR